MNCLNLGADAPSSAVIADEVAVPAARRAPADSPGAAGPGPGPAAEPDAAASPGRFVPPYLHVGTQKTKSS
jgi:hypothetical protein